MNIVCLPHLARRRILLGLAGGAVAACSRPDAPAPSVAAAPSAAPAAGAREAFDAASRGSGFVVGQPMAARQLLVFFDPQCPHCAALWVASRPLRDRVRMTWMPVAFMSPASAPQGALLLAATDATATMDRHEALLAGGQGGLPVAASADDAGLAKIAANTELWKTTGAASVPHLVYRAGADGPYGVESGGLPTEQLAQRLAL